MKENYFEVQNRVERFKGDGLLNVITFLTKTKLPRQVRDILKKTKGVIIITIALHVLLASWYISRHGRLVQISNNLAGPRGEIF